MESTMTLGEFIIKLEELGLSNDLQSICLELVSYHEKDVILKIIELKDQFGEEEFKFKLLDMMPEVKNNHNDEFKKKPKILPFFKKEFKKFTPNFKNKAKKVFKLQDKEFIAKKLTVVDTIRLTSKLPQWLNYIAYNSPEMIIDKETGQYKIMQTVLTLLERVFSDFDYEKQTPTDFGFSVLEELSNLLNIKEQDPVHFIMNCEMDELYEAISVYYEVNQSFFLKIWRKSGVTTKILTLISGVLSKDTTAVNGILENFKKEMSQNPEKELETL